MEYRKYAIFLGIILIVAGTIACGGKDTASEKDRIKEIEVKYMMMTMNLSLIHI